MNSVMTGLDSIPETAIAVYCLFVGECHYFMVLVRNCQTLAQSVRWYHLDCAVCNFTYPNSIRRQQCSTCPSHLWTSFWCFNQRNPIGLV